MKNHTVNTHSKQAPTGVAGYTGIALCMLPVALFTAYGSWYFIQYSITGTELYFVHSGKFDAAMSLALGIALSGVAFAIQAATKASTTIAEINGKRPSKWIKPFALLGVIIATAISAYTIFQGSESQIIQKTINQEKSGEHYKALAAAPAKIQKEIDQLNLAIISAKGTSVKAEALNCNTKYRSCRNAKTEQLRIQAKAEKAKTNSRKDLLIDKEKAEVKLQKATAELNDKDQLIKRIAKQKAAKQQGENMLYAILPDVLANLFWFITLYLLGGMSLIFKKITILHQSSTSLHQSSSGAPVHSTSEILTPMQAEQAFREAIQKREAILSKRAVSQTYNGAITEGQRDIILKDCFNQQWLNRKQDKAKKFTYFYPEEGEAGGETLWYQPPRKTPQLKLAGG